MEEREYLYALASLTGLTRKHAVRLFERYGTFSWITSGLSQQECEELQLPEPLFHVLRSGISAERICEMQKSLRTAGYGFVSLWDADFPTLLREIPDPPLWLFYRGDLGLCHRPCIGVVGTRKPSPYGRSACQYLTRELALSGLVIVSGAASGIDAEAHQTALAAGAGTIAVLGCGIDLVYPARHLPLYRQIASRGLLLSEYPPGMEARNWTFPERNRLISGLSLGVLVVEAAERSGSLITADCALEQGRDVFAVPGSIFQESSKGTLHLLKQGAKIVTNVTDILEEYPALTLPDRETSKEKQLLANLTAGERLLLELIGHDPVHWDELYARLSVEHRPQLDVSLIGLEAKRLISSLPGGYFARLAPLSV